MNEMTWLSSADFRKLHAHLKKGEGAARTPGGRRRFRLFACACCRCLLWHLPVRDCDRQLVETAEAFAEGLIAREQLEEARFGYSPPQDEARLPTRASAAMLETTVERAASAAYSVVPQALAALPQEDRVENRWRLCELLRDVFGNPFRPLLSRDFPAHVVELARECYAAFPKVSNRFLILADALADLGEEQAAEHCRQAEHVKGCHVLDWIRGRK
jgi:hypothetical protein